MIPGFNYPAARALFNCLDQDQFVEQVTRLVEDRINSDCDFSQDELDELINSLEML